MADTSGFEVGDVVNVRPPGEVPFTAEVIRYRQISDQLHVMRLTVETDGKAARIGGPCGSTLVSPAHCTHATTVDGTARGYWTKRGWVYMGVLVHDARGELVEIRS